MSVKKNQIMNTLKNKHLKKFTKHVPFIFHLQSPFVSNALFINPVCHWNSELPPKFHVYTEAYICNSRFLFF